MSRFCCVLFSSEGRVLNDDRFLDRLHLWINATLGITIVRTELCNDRMQATGLMELEAVVAVARCRNFRVAAAELNRSRSAVSHTVATLEQRLGVRLFNRTTRSVSLTEAGQLF